MTTLSPGHAGECARACCRIRRRSKRSTIRPMWSLTGWPAPNLLRHKHEGQAAAQRPHAGSRHRHARHGRVEPPGRRRTMRSWRASGPGGGAGKGGASRGLARTTHAGPCRDPRPLPLRPRGLAPELRRRRAALLPERQRPLGQHWAGLPALSGYATARLMKAELDAKRTLVATEASTPTGRGCSASSPYRSASTSTAKAGLGCRRLRYRRQKLEKVHRAGHRPHRAPSSDGVGSGSKVALGEEHMHALVAVHGLRHAQVAGQRAEHVSLVARQVGARADLAHHLAHRLLRRVVQVLVEAD